MNRNRRVDIHKYLPHRSPMLMVDYIIELDPEKVVATFKIENNNIFLQEGQLAAVGLIEHAAQTCSSILGQSFFQESDDNKLIGYITNIKKITLLQLPNAGDDIRSKATLLSMFGNLCQIYCETFREEELLLKTEISLLIQEA